MTRLRTALILFGSLFPLGAEASFSINFTFESGLTPSQRAIFNEAKATWESYITGYQPNIIQTGIDINAKGEAIHGAGGTLGSARPTTGISQGGYLVARTGTIIFDIADLADIEADGRPGSSIAHELGHALGIGTLWGEDHNDVYVNGSGQYTGAFSLAAYKDEFDPLASYLPPELDRESDSPESHRNENNGGGEMTDHHGPDPADEPLPEWIGGKPNHIFISNTTPDMLQGLGFAVDMPIPEPSPALLTGLAVMSVVFPRRRAQSW